MAITSETHNKRLLGDFDMFQESFQRVAEDAAFAFENTKRLRQQADEAVLRNSFPHARNVAIELVRVLHLSCFEAMRLQSDGLVETWLSQLCHELGKFCSDFEESADTFSSKSRQWPKCALETARFLYAKLRGDATLSDVPIGASRGQVTGSEASMIIESCKNVHALVISRAYVDSS